MPTGSTSALRLPSQLPYGRLQNPTHFARSHLITLARLPHSRFSTTCYPQDVLGQRSKPENRIVSATSNNRPIPTDRTPCSNHPLATPGLYTFSSGKGTVSHLAGLDSPGTQQQGQALSHAKRKCPSQRRRTLLWVMLTAKSPDRAWAAYQELLSCQATIPPHLLHQLIRLLALVKPRTRTVHLQLLSVLKSLRGHHGQLRLWEWNMLIDSAGKHWHKTRLEDYENALDIFNKRGILSVETAVATDEALSAETNSCVTQQEPDIWTYNILLSIASRTNSPLAVRHASSLLLGSGLSPNRYTHLCLLRYFAARKDLRSVCSTLHKMKHQGLEVGLDGINACLWAHARSGHLDVAMCIYRVLRSNVKPVLDREKHDIEDDICYIRGAIGLDIPCGFEPDEITYTMMIQALAYHGDLGNALSVFVDMLSTPNREAVAQTGAATVQLAHYKPSMATFRGLFLGFARHGRSAQNHAVGSEPVAALFPSSQIVWGQDTLEAVFAAFLLLPSQPKPTKRLLYWIVVAFNKTSGDDTVKLREVWTKLEAKYGGGWGGRLEEIRRSIFPLDDHKAELN